MTLAMPKSGLLTGAARNFVGDLYLADISVPGELYEKMELNSAVNKKVFSGNPVLRLVF